MGCRLMVLSSIPLGRFDTISLLVLSSKPIWDIATALGNPLSREFILYINLKSRPMPTCHLGLVIVGFTRDGVVAKKFETDWRVSRGISLNIIIMTLNSRIIFQTFPMYLRGPVKMPLLYCLLYWQVNPNKRYKWTLAKQRRITKHRFCSRLITCD